MSYYLEENGTDRYLLEDGSGLLLIEPALVLNQTLGSITLSSTVAVADGAALSETLGAITLSSATAVLVSAALNETLGSLTLSSAATAAEIANFAETLGLLSLSSSVTTGAVAPPTIAGIISGRIPRSDGSQKSLQKIFDRADPNKFVAREQIRLKSLSQLRPEHIAAHGGNRLSGTLEELFQKQTDRKLEREYDEEAILHILSLL
jgi:hypothetical protein